MKYKGLEVFEVSFDNSEWENVSLVDRPAIEVNFLRFSKDEEIRMTLNEEQRIVSGPVLIPGQMIYRQFGDRECYIRFSADTIKQFAIDFFRSDKQNEGNIQHMIDAEGITFWESYILNKDRGIVPVEFADLPDGTWILSAKIDNEGVWEAIKNGEIKGFSIGVQATITPSKDEIDSLEDLIDALKA